AAAPRRRAVTRPGAQDRGPAVRHTPRGEHDRHRGHDRRAVRAHGAGQHRPGGGAGQGPGRARGTQRRPARRSAADRELPRRGRVEAGRAGAGPRRGQGRVAQEDLNRSRGRRGAWWLAAAVVVALAVVLTFIAFRGSGDDDRLSVKAYGAAIRPHLLDGGRIAAEDMRPGLADLEFHRVTPERFREEAAAWRRGMERVRQALARLRPPHNLERAASLYDLALRQYEEAIDGFVVASR